MVTTLLRGSNLMRLIHAELASLKSRDGVTVDDLADCHNLLAVLGTWTPEAGAVVLADLIDSSDDVDICALGLALNIDGRTGTYLGSRRRSAGVTLSAQKARERRGAEKLVAYALRSRSQPGAGVTLQAVGPASMSWSWHDRRIHVSAMPAEDDLTAITVAGVHTLRCLRLAMLPFGDRPWGELYLDGLLSSCPPMWLRVPLSEQVGVVYSTPDGWTAPVSRSIYAIRADEVDALDTRRELNEPVKVDFNFKEFVVFVWWFGDEPSSAEELEVLHRLRVLATDSAAFLSSDVATS